MGSSPVTLLFTDLVNSTELLQRAGDEQAQRIFQAHHRLLKRFVAAHGGQEVKWLGDGFMTVFASPADAVRCAVAMQLAARRRAASGRLAIRVGLNRRRGAARGDRLLRHPGGDRAPPVRRCASRPDPVQRAGGRAARRPARLHVPRLRRAGAQGPGRPGARLRGRLSAGSAAGAADAHAVRRPRARSWRG